MIFLFSERERSLLSEVGEVAAKCILRWTKPRSFFSSPHTIHNCMKGRIYLVCIMILFPKLNYSVKKAATVWKKQAPRSWRPAWPLWVWNSFFVKGINCIWNFGAYVKQHFYENKCEQSLKLTVVLNKTQTAWWCQGILDAFFISFVLGSTLHFLRQYQGPRSKS